MNNLINFAGKRVLLVESRKSSLLQQEPEMGQLAFNGAQTSSKNSKAGQRRLRTETAIPLAFVTKPNSNIRAKLGLAQSPIPKDVLEIYQKYNSLEEVLLDKLESELGNRVKNATMLIKYHLFKPDEEGRICKLALGNPCITLELIHYCLPDRKYLEDHPQCIDDLRERALKQKFIPEDVISFLSDRDKVKNCPERDAFFYGQYAYEMEMAGANKEESFAGFIKRKNLSSAEYKLLVSKLPLTVRRHLETINFNNALNVFSSIDCALGNKEFEKALIFLKWNIEEPSFYAKPAPNFHLGSCHQIIKNHLQFTLSKTPESTFLDLIKHTFPSKEYREANKQNLSTFLSDFASETARIGINDKKLALEIFNFISEESRVNLNDLEKLCNNQAVTKFLKDNGLLN